MHKYMETHSESLTSVEGSVKAWCRALKTWNQARSIRRAATKNADNVPGLDARIRYDIGQSDYRPPSPESVLSTLKAYPLSVEAMMKRSV